MPLTAVQYIWDALELTREIVVKMFSKTKSSVWDNEITITYHLKLMIFDRFVKHDGLHAQGQYLQSWGTILPCVYVVLHEVHQSGRDEYAMKAGGYLNLLEKFSTYFGLKLSLFVFSVTEQLSTTLPSQSISLQEAKHQSSQRVIFGGKEQTLPIMSSMRASWKNHKT